MHLIKPSCLGAELLDIDLPLSASNVAIAISLMVAEKAQAQ